MKTLVVIVAASLAAAGAMAGPELSGTPDELVAHLRAIPGQVTLTGEGEAKVEADRAEIVVKVRNSDRSFRTALAQNQQMRAEILAALEKAGIPADCLRMSRFSSTPTQGYFSSKVKSYEIESRVTIEASSEKELQSAAAVVDEKEGVSLQSLTFRNTQSEKHKADALTQALAKVRALKKTYERALGVSLLPRAIGPQPAPASAEFARRRVYAGMEVSGTSSVLTDPELGLVVHALAQREPDISQFDQVLYRAAVSVTFDVVREEKK